MKKFSPYLICILFLGMLINTAYCQEEFFGNHNGMSLGYLQGLNKSAHAEAVSIYFKRGIIFGFAYEHVSAIEYPTLALQFCPMWNDVSTTLKTTFGFSLTGLPETNVLGMNIGLVKRILIQSNFPGAVNLSISPQVSLDREMLMDNIIMVFGGGYTQAFFAKNRIYPVLALSYSQDLDSKIQIFSAMVSLNIRLDQPQE